MPRVKDYFDQTTYKSQYFLGDRVIVNYQSLTLTGTVMVDHLVDPEIGPTVKVFLDQPVQVDTGSVSLVTLAHKQIALLQTKK